MSILENVPLKMMKEDSKQLEENFKNKFNLNFEGLIIKTLFLSFCISFIFI